MNLQILQTNFKKHLWKTKKGNYSVLQQLILVKISYYLNLIALHFIAETNSAGFVLNIFSEIHLLYLESVLNMI